MSSAEKMKQLTLAMESLDKELAKKLIIHDQIEPTDVTDQQYSRFFKLAVESRDAPLVRKLLEARPKLDGTDGSRLLWTVIDDTDTQIAEMLVRAGADVNQSFHQDWSSLLHVLAKSDSPSKRKLAVLIMDCGADVTAEDANGCSACGIAIIRGNLAFAQEILRRDVAVDEKLLWMAVCSPTPVESMLLLVNGDHIEDATTRSQLVAYTFCQLCQFSMDDENILDMVKALLDLEIPAAANLFDAVRREKFKVVKLLLERAEIGKSVKMMFLHKAMISKRSTMARMLIEWGADIEYKDSDDEFNRDMRPLHDACIYGARENIQLLLHLGADVTATDIYGMTPFTFLVLNFEPIPGGNLSDEQLIETSQLVTKHFALLVSKGDAVDVDDLALIHSDTILKKYYKKCLAELQAMKRVKIVAEMSFHSIFTTSIQELSLLTRRQVFLESYNDHCNSFFVYRNDLNMRVREAERRKNLLMPVENALSETLRGILPDIPREKIIRYLYLNQIETLKDRIMMLDS